MGGDLLRDDGRCREAFRRGERWAMEAVYRHYVPLVHTIVSQGFGGFRGFFDPTQREDAVQAIFMSAFDERARLAYDGLGDYTRYLRGIAHNVCRQLLDKDRRFARTPEVLPTEDDDLELRLLADEERALARQFRDGLGE
ncbi:MAG TPA: hypothetical protein PK095_10085, partial [Myxococcota bacterium]|nr:hypothetical protein [Myxococcota bacterium]